MQQGGGPSGPPLEGTRLADQLRSAEPASPIRSWPPAPPPAANFDTSVGHGNPVADGVVDTGESSAATGSNRWPRQETLALLKIRSEMDTAFRDAPLKAPLWDEVARKLGELGYIRSGKKCKEKFENVHKYYKRTKEGRSGRQDGKSYRFFNQLEALHGSPGGSIAIAASVAPAITLFATTAATVTTHVDELPVTILPASSSGPNPPSVTASPAAITQPVAPTVVTTPIAAPLLQPIAPQAISFSSSSSESKDEREEWEGREGRKRKRGGSHRKMAAFFDGLMRQLTERQEAMQRHFLEMIEKQEEERLVREEAWRRHATAQLAREHELLVQERAAAASRDAAIIAFLQKLTGHNIQLPPITTVVEASAPAPPPSQLPPQPQSNHPPQTPSTHEMLRVQHQLAPSSSALPLAPANTQEIVDRGGVIISEHLASSSRWPKVEVHALIRLRSSLDTKYQEAGPKGPLWEEISSEMLKLGYNRNPKRCKEKWENINKYFKKVKESNRKRPQDAKTCPYFHQLDALYRQKLIGNTGISSASASHMTINQIAHHQPQETSDHTPNPIIPNPIVSSGAHATPPPPPPPQVHPAEGGGSGNNNRNSGNADCTEASGSGEMMKEGIAKEMMAKLEKSKDAMDDYSDRLEEHESDHLDEDDDDDFDYDDEDDDDEADKKMQYKVQLQRPDNASGSGGAAPATGSFLSMV